MAENIRKQEDLQNKISSVDSENLTLRRELDDLAELTAFVRGSVLNPVKAIEAEPGITTPKGSNKTLFSNQKYATTLTKPPSMKSLVQKKENLILQVRASQPAPAVRMSKAGAPPRPQNQQLR